MIGYDPNDPDRKERMNRYQIAREVWQEWRDKRKGVQYMWEFPDYLNEQQAEPKDTTILENRQKLEQQAEEEE